MERKDFLRQGGPCFYFDTELFAPTTDSFALVHRPERLSDLFCTLRAHGLEPKRLRFVASSAENAPSLALVEARRGGKTGLSVEPMLFIGSADWDEVYFRT